MYNGVKSGRHYIITANAIIESQSNHDLVRKECYEYLLLFFTSNFLRNSEEKFKTELSGARKIIKGDLHLD